MSIATLLVALSAGADIAADNADNAAYSDGWTTGDNGGNGFGAWTLATSGSGGNYTGDTGISGADNSFGLWSHSGGSSTAERSFNNALSAGHTFSVNLGHTATINGSIGLGLYNDTTEVIRLRFVGGASNWVLSDGGADFNAGQNYAANTTLTFSFTYNGGSSYDYSFGSGSGVGYTASSDISSINGVKLFNFDQGNGENLGFNDLSVIPEPAVMGFMLVMGTGTLFIRRIFML